MQWLHGAVKSAETARLGVVEAAPAEMRPAGHL